MRLPLYFSSLKPSFTFKSKLFHHHLRVTLQTVLCYCAKPSSSGDHLQNFRRTQRENHSPTKSFRLVLPISGIYSTPAFKTAVLASAAQPVTTTTSLSPRYRSRPNREGSTSITVIIPANSLMCSSTDFHAQRKLSAQVSLKKKIIIITYRRKESRRQPT